jgi:hypothetical protein
VRSAARYRPAFATGSCGKRIASSVRLRSPTRSASVSNPLRMPRRPPSPEIASGPIRIGGLNSSERMTRNE